MYTFTDALFQIIPSIKIKLVKPMIITDVLFNDVKQPFSTPRPTGKSGPFSHLFLISDQRYVSLGYTTYP